MKNSLNRMSQHVCNRIESFPLEKFHQLGKGRGRKILIIGESPAPNGWRISNRACYTKDGKLLPTGKRLNLLIAPFGLPVDVCGFTELSKCYVTKRSALAGCSKQCWPIFTRQIKGKGYKILLILGVHTTKIFSWLAGKELDIGRIQDVLIDGKKYNVLPLYHPSPVNPHGQSRNERIFKKEGRALSLLLK